MMKKVCVYVDGFNLYHAIKELNKPHLKWVNLMELAKSFLAKDEIINEVYYFSAFPTWRPDTHKRHMEYVRALEHFGVRCVMGNFKRKKNTCRSCGTNWRSHEEKETDVHIAVKIVEDAFLDRYDRAIIISADSDLIPPKVIVNNNYPNKKVNFIAPPKRFSHARVLKPIMEITAGRINKSLLPSQALDLSGNIVFKRPAPYNPPK